MKFYFLIVHFASPFFFLFSVFFFTMATLWEKSNRRGYCLSGRGDWDTKLEKEKGRRVSATVGGPNPSPRNDTVACVRVAWTANPSQVSINIHLYFIVLGKVEEFQEDCSCKGSFLYHKQSKLFAETRRRGPSSSISSIFQQGRRGKDLKGNMGFGLSSLIYSKF